MSNRVCVVQLTGPVSMTDSMGKDRDLTPSSSSMRSSNDERSRRKKNKRIVAKNGGGGLQFVTATNPDQFRDEQTRKSVRSQAMLHYRKVQAGETRTSPASVENVTSDQGTELTQYSGRRDDMQEYPISSTSSKQEQSPRIVNYEYSDSHEEFVLRMLVARLTTIHSIGDGIDPFNVAPKYRSPDLNFNFLQLSCLRAMASDETLKRWSPTMSSHAHVMLSSPILTSTWLDMHSGYSGDSKRTAILKGEVISMLNERLSEPRSRGDEETLAVILHLLAGEIWTCNEQVLRIHRDGVARFIAQRGGIVNLSNRVIAEVAAACCNHCSIFCEEPAMPLFATWQPSYFSFIDNFGTIPESPLFCPRPVFFTLRDDELCKNHTYELLSDVRYMTNLFLKEDAMADSQKISTNGQAQRSRTPSDLLAISQIFQKVAALPSAYQPGLPTSNDWVYETCRITALIYTTAITMNVPFSTAAAMSYQVGNSTIAPTCHTQRAVHLACALHSVLRRTDTANIWNNMSGVLYWVTAVGAAAARTPATLDLRLCQRPIGEENQIWVRRCLSLFAMRTMIILIFKHPVPMLKTQMRLLAVQRLLADGGEQATT